MRRGAAEALGRLVHHASCHEEEITMKTVKIRSRHSRRQPNGSVFALVLGVGFAPVTPALGQVNVPPGYEVVRLTDDEWLDLKPTINNLGHVVWAKRIGNSDGQEIFLYDAIQVRQITNNNVAEEQPDINDHGVMVWSRRVKPELYADGQEIIVFDGTTERMITDNEYLDTGPRINNLGHVVWSQYTGGACHPSRQLLWDGIRTTVIVDDGFNNGGAEINDFDQFAWTRYDDCAGPSTWKGMIRFYTGREIINITDGTREDQGATLNNLGLIGYIIGYPETGIATWSHGRQGMLVDWEAFGKVNNIKVWAISRWHDELNKWQVWIWNGGPSRLTDFPAENHVADGNNDCGEIVWGFGSSSPRELMLLRLISGDANHDGRVEDADALWFHIALTGPRAGTPSCEGPGADLDRDSDVDLLDFAVMQAADVLPVHFERLVGCMVGPRPRRDTCASLAIDFDRDGDVDLKDFAGFQAVLAK
jgi:hypothetical protein